MFTRLDWNHEFQHVTQEGLSIDIANPGTKQGWLVCGPTHYLRDVATGDYVVNGPTQFKSRLLRALGWQIRHIPFFEWAY